MQLFNSNSFLHCEHVILEFHYEILLKNVYDYIWLYSSLELHEESRIKVAIHYKLSSVIPFTGNSECHISLDYCALNNSFRREGKKKSLKSFQIQFRIELFGSNLGEHKKNYQIFHNFHLNQVTPLGPILIQKLKVSRFQQIR